MKKATRLSMLGVMILVTGLVIGCASAYMVKTNQLEKGSDFAIVNFIRPSMFGGAIKFGVWDRDQLVGVLTPECCIQYKASPGEHLFLVRAENWGVLKANVTAGKTYTILAEPRMGLMKANVKLTIVKPGDQRLKEWMRGVNYVQMDPAQRAGYVKGRADEALRATKNVESGSAEPDDVLRPEDGE